jgi:hypothetical protein
MSTLFTFDDVTVKDLSLKTAHCTHNPTHICKTFPGDRAWLSTDLWNFFSELFGGAIIKTILIGAPCYVGLNYASLNNAKEIKIMWKRKTFILIFRMQIAVPM